MNKTFLKLAVVLGLLLVCFLAGRKTAEVVSNHHKAIETASGTESKNWGLGFGEPGQPPTGNESQEELQQHHAYFLGDEKKIYLTFDCGYENGNMDNILSALKKHGVTATFFVVGNFIQDNQELVKRMAEEGHNIGNHSFTHPDMSAMGEEEFKKQLTDLENKYKEVTGKDIVKLYRPPQGKYSLQSLDMANALGYKTIFWSLAYVDWYEDKQPTKEEAFEKLLTRIHPGAIVLLHSTSKTNGEILDELLTKWEEMGYEFGDLKELD